MKPIVPAIISEGSDYLSLFLGGEEESEVGKCTDSFSTGL